MIHIRLMACGEGYRAGTCRSRRVQDSQQVAHACTSLHESTGSRAAARGCRRRTSLEDEREPQLRTSSALQRKAPERRHSAGAQRTPESVSSSRYQNDWRREQTMCEVRTSKPREMRCEQRPRGSRTQAAMLRSCRHSHERIEHPRREQRVEGEHFGHDGVLPERGANAIAHDPTRLRAASA